VAIFTTNVDAENQTLINHKCVCGALNRHFCQTRVISWPSVLRPCKPLTILRFAVFVVSAGVVAYFLFSEGREDFFNSILSGWDRHTLCQALVCALACAAWQCVWLVGWLFIVLPLSLFIVVLQLL